MYVSHLRVRNFRRLRDVLIGLDPEISIFVGANNSGKTSASEALDLFVSGGRDRFSLYDFNVECWKAIDDFGERVEGVALPKLTLDIWLHVDDVDLHRMIDLLPSLGWEGTEVGMRVEYGPQDEGQLLSRFSVARDKARENTRNNADGSIGFHPTPRVLTEYLRDKLGKEYKSFATTSSIPPNSIRNSKRLEDTSRATVHVPPCIAGMARSRSPSESRSRACTLARIGFYALRASPDSTPT